jgi:LL-diaminopimelate aminotransferase
MQTANRLHTVEEYYFSQKLREIEQLNKQGKNIINLGIGSPDLAPHPSVIEALYSEATKPNTHAYQSYKGNAQLRHSLADFYNQYYDVTLHAETEVLPLVGSKEGIMHICMTYVNDGDIVLVPNPGYPTYSSAAKLAGAQIVYYDLLEENNWLPNFTFLAQQIDALQAKGKRIALLFLSYPHMPSGALPEDNVFENMIALAKQKQFLVVHDNPYSFIRNNNPKSILQVEGAKDVCIELNSLSKSHNMAGWRVGFLVGNENYINDVLRFKSNMDSGMFLPVQLAAAKALTLDSSWFTVLNEVYKKREAKAFELLDKLNCTYNKTQSGLFVWAKIPSSFKDGYALCDDVLYNSNVFVTPGGIFGSNGSNYIRVSLCATETIFNEAIVRLK